MKLLVVIQCWLLVCVYPEQKKKKVLVYILVCPDYVVGHLRETHRKLPVIFVCIAEFYTNSVLCTMFDASGGDAEDDYVTRMSKDQIPKAFYKHFLSVTDKVRKNLSHDKCHVINYNFAFT